jgi:hypothetical protein
MPVSFIKATGHLGVYRRNETGELGLRVSKLYYPLPAARDGRKRRRMETGDANVMTRRDLLKTAAPASVAGLVRAAVPEYKMGVATTSFTGAAGPRPAGGGRPAVDTMAFLERCHGLGAGGFNPRWVET